MIFYRNHAEAEVRTCNEPGLHLSHAVKMHHGDVGSKHLWQSVCILSFYLRPTRNGDSPFKTPINRPMQQQSFSDGFVGRIVAILWELLFHEPSLYVSIVICRVKISRSLVGSANVGFSMTYWFGIARFNSQRRKWRK